MCDCVEAAINRNYIIQGCTYDETNHEYVHTSEFWMPLSVRNEKGRFERINMTIKHCPICGEKLLDTFKPVSKEAER
jgi:hypothetical protein